jgi:hypothetical protein
MTVNQRDSKSPLARPLFLIATLLTCVPLSSARADDGDARADAQAKAADTLPWWRGKSAGLDVLWTSGDLSAASPKKTVFSARARAAAAEAPPTGCMAVEHWSLSAVAGPLVSVEILGEQACSGAPPALERRLETIDLSKGPAPLSLADVFGEEAVKQALLADGVVKKALAASAASGAKAPVTLADLVAAVSSGGLACEVALPEGLLTRWALHHLEKGKVAVRVAVPDTCDTSTGKLRQLGLLFAAPAALAADLQAADAKKTGFLMKDAKPLAGKSTSVDVGVGH